MGKGKCAKENRETSTLGKATFAPIDELFPTDAPEELIRAILAPQTEKSKGRFFLLLASRIFQCLPGGARHQGRHNNCC